VYFRPDSVFVASAAKDEFGIHVTGDHCARLDRPPTVCELGDAVLVALAAYKENVPGRLYVRGVKQPPDPLLAFARFRSRKAFERDARHFLVTSDDKTVEITPTIPGPTGGFLHQPASTVRCASSADAVGSTLLRLAELRD
jgi:hypothetical protein